MKTIEITDEAFELLNERMGNSGAESVSDLIIAMDQTAQFWCGKYADLKEGRQHNPPSLKDFERFQVYPKEKL